MSQSSYEEYPPKADLRKQLCQPLPFIAPGTVDANTMGGDEASNIVLAVLDTLNTSLATDDSAKFASCFFSSQAYWRDMLALTSHLRTFRTPEGIAAAFLQTKTLRGVTGGMRLASPAQFTPATPVLQFIQCDLVFRTSSPAAACSGRLILLPTKVGSNEPSPHKLEWKIWVLSTWIENLDLQAEDESLLQVPGKNLDGLDTIKTDVLIIGGGNAGITLAARLKALGVENIMIDKNSEVGQNWTQRYDCLRFHLPTASCEMPYLHYEKHLQSPHLLSKDEVAEHLKRYVAAFNLNVITSANIRSTVYDQAGKQWLVKFRTPNGDIEAVCKQLVQATGIGSSKPYLPPMLDNHLYKGINFHSAQYKNAKLLAEQGAKSVLVVGSANTAFDIIEDCYDAGLQTTIVARSPTYVYSIDYVNDIHALGAYDHMPIETVDKMFMTFPLSVDSQLSHGLFSHLASLEPDRYKALAAAGFPVIDSRHPDANVQHHLSERAGGHYVDLDVGVRLISEGKVGVRGSVEPVAYTATGLRLSDGTTVDADAVVWCTGFADLDVRTTATEILGGGNDTDTDTTNFTSNAETENSGFLGPSDIAARLDATWGVDAEGEIRGTWKRHLRLDNYWIMGGNIQQQRWWSRVLAQQIKMALEGVLLDAYRDVPRVKL